MSDKLVGGELHHLKQQGRYRKEGGTHATHAQQGMQLHGVCANNATGTPTCLAVKVLPSDLLKRVRTSSSVRMSSSVTTCAPCATRNSSCKSCMLGLTISTTCFACMQLRVMSQADDG